MTLHQLPLPDGEAANLRALVEDQQAQLRRLRARYDARLEALESLTGAARLEALTERLEAVEAVTVKRPKGGSPRVYAAVEARRDKIVALLESARGVPFPATSVHAVLAATNDELTLEVVSKTLIRLVEAGRIQTHDVGGAGRATHYKALDGAA